MSAIARGYFAAHYGPGRTLIVDSAKNSSSGKFWSHTDAAALNAAAEASIQAADDDMPVPTQPAGSTYTTVLLAANGGDTR